MKFFGLKMNAPQRNNGCLFRSLNESNVINGCVYQAILTTHGNEQVNNYIPISGDFGKHFSYISRNTFIALYLFTNDYRNMFKRPIWENIGNKISDYASLLYIYIIYTVFDGI